MQLRTRHAVRARRGAAVARVVTRHVVGLPRRHGVDPGVVDEADVVLGRRLRLLRLFVLAFDCTNRLQLQCIT